MKLPLDCSAQYINAFLTEEESDAIYSTLLTEFNLDKARLVIEAGDRMIETDSFKILFASQTMIDQNTHPEEIHGKSYVWSGVLDKLKTKIELLLNKKFELAMCIYYPNGTYYAPYHSDQETSGNNTILPSISLGEPREFSFRHKMTQEVFNLELTNGSLLIMGEYCQSRYEHSLLQNDKYKGGRINITFRDPSFK